MKKKKGMTLTGKRAVVGLLFISPWIVGFLAFYVRSFIMTIQFALSEVNVNPGVGGYTTKFLGLENFVYEFTKHPNFSQTLVTSLQDILIDVPLIVFFSLFMALLLNKKFTGRTLVRAIFFIPVIMNADAIVSAIEMARSAMMGGVSATSAAIAESTSGGVNIEYYLSLFKELALPDSLLDYVVYRLLFLSRHYSQFRPPSTRWQKLRVRLDTKPSGKLHFRWYCRTLSQILSTRWSIPLQTVRLSIWHTRQRTRIRSGDLVPR